MSANPRLCTCGAELTPSEGICRECGRKHFVLRAEPGQIQYTGYPPAIVIDGKDPETGETHIRVNSPDATSEARVSPTGEIRLQVEGAEAGRKSELWTIKTLRQALRSSGIAASKLEAADSRGEDAVFRVENVDYVVQVATTPSVPEFWREASTSSARTEVGRQKGVEWLRQTIENKAAVIPPSQRATTILAVDARHAGVLAADPLVAASYCSQFNSPACEYGFASVWIVGPTTKHCVRLGDGIP
jgi:hypothetical protein